MDELNASKIGWMASQNRSAEVVEFKVESKGWKLLVRFPRNVRFARDRPLSHRARLPEDTLLSIYLHALILHRPSVPSNHLYRLQIDGTLRADFL